MTTFAFEDATREQAKARIGLQGPAGSGKTKTALRIAERLADGGLIGLADTERRTALKYAPVPGRPDLGGYAFKHLPMDTHDPRHLTQVVATAEAAGIVVLIVDSWSPFWNGKGGLLEIVDEAGRKPGAGGSFGGWQVGNPVEQQMLDALLNFDGHLIVTMRTKGDYAIEGKKVTKLGVRPIQREGTEYELDVVMDMVEGTATVTKTRYDGLADLVIHHPGPEVAEIILEQLGQGVDPLEVILDSLTAEGVTLETVLTVQADAARRRLLANGVLHPRTAEPTTLVQLLQEYGVDLIEDALDADGLTYEGALKLHVQAQRGGWLSAPLPNAEGDRPLGDRIKERGIALKPKPQAAPGDSGLAAVQAPPVEEPPAEGPGEPADQGEPPTSQQPAPSGASVATAPQMRMIFASLAELGIKNADRKQRLLALGLIVGRPLASANELTFGDAKTVIDAINQFVGEDAPERFRAHLNELLAAAQGSPTAQS